MKAARGFTLIELLVAATIMIVAVVLAGALIVAGVNLTNTATQRGDEADQLRTAMDTIVNDLRNAGSGAPQGVWVSVGGTPVQLSAISGVNGTDGKGTTTSTCPDTGTGTAVAPATDDLWLIVPDKNALREACKDPGAATTIMSAGTGPLKVGCTASFTAGDLLLATNMDTGALLTSKTLTPPSPGVAGVIDYNESSTGISDAPDRGGFQTGDMVYRASLVHYFVMNDAAGVSGLYRSTGSLTGAAPTGYPNGDYPQAGRPFFDSATALVQKNIDDLQIAYGFDTTGDGNPNNFSWQNGLAPTICSASSPNPVKLRAVRISLEVQAPTLMLNNKNEVLKTIYTQHMKIEDNYSVVAQPAPDGHQRMLYTRTIELPNVAPGSL